MNFNSFLGTNEQSNKRAQELKKHEMNGETYFDQDERSDGALINEATGKNYNNSTDMDSESPEMSAVSKDNKNFKDLEDENAKLLREQFKNNPEILKELGLD